MFGNVMFIIVLLIWILCGLVGWVHYIKNDHSIGWIDVILLCGAILGGPMFLVHAYPKIVDVKFPVLHIHIPNRKDK